MKIMKHLIAAPAANEAYAVTVYLSTQKRHVATGVCGTGTDIGGGKAKLSAHG